MASVNMMLLLGRRQEAVMLTRYKSVRSTVHSRAMKLNELPVKLSTVGDNGRKDWRHATYSSSSSDSSLGRATSSSSCFLFLVDISALFNCFLCYTGDYLSMLASL